MGRKIIIIGLTFLLCMLLVIQFVGTPFPWKLWQAKQDSIAYLEEKYGEPFKVGIPLFWIMDGNFHAQASPKARPDLVFSVGTKQGADGIQDSYEYERKKYELEHEIQQIVAQAFPSGDVEVYMDTYFGMDGRNETDDLIRIILDTQVPLQEISTKLYPLVQQLQVLPVYSFTFIFEYKELYLRHDTELQREEAFHALWQDIE